MLAVSLYPLASLLRSVVMRIYPVGDEVARELERFSIDKAPLGVVLLVFAVVPPLCEELAFRGFILSGLRHLGHKWRAIVISSIFFAVTHAIFQQSLLACLLGLVIGYLAVQTGSLLPCIAFHVTNNSLAVMVHRYLPDWLAADPGHSWLGMVVSTEAGSEIFFSWPVVFASVLISAGLLWWFQRLPYVRTAEEKLQDAIEQQAPQVVA